MNAAAADLLQRYEARIASLERLVSKQALELEFLKGALKSTAAERDYVRRCRPPGFSIARMPADEIARATFYDKPATQDDTAIVAADFHDLRNSNSMVGGAFAPTGIRA